MLVTVLNLFVFLTVVVSLFVSVCVTAHARVGYFRCVPECLCVRLSRVRACHCLFVSLSCLCARVVVSRHVTSRHATPRHATPRHVTSRHAFSFVTPHLLTTRYCEEFGPFCVEFVCRVNTKSNQAGTSRHHVQRKKKAARRIPIFKAIFTSSGCTFGDTGSSATHLRVWYYFLRIRVSCLAVHEQSTRTRADKENSTVQSTRRREQGKSERASFKRSGAVARPLRQ